MHRIRVSLGPYGYWLKRRDEDDPKMIPDALEKKDVAPARFQNCGESGVGPQRGLVRNDWLYCRGGFSDIGHRRTHS
jgi:hypothetical protein